MITDIPHPPAYPGIGPSLQPCVDDKRSYRVDNCKPLDCLAPRCDWCRETIAKAKEKAEKVGQKA